jgi:hypothetical protein
VLILDKPLSTTILPQGLLDCSFGCLQPRRRISSVKLAKATPVGCRLFLVSDMTSMDSKRFPICPEGSKVPQGSEEANV